MNYIELIGPPSVGKTTLLNTLANSRKTNEWATYEEATYDIVDSLTWSQLYSPKSKLLYLINKVNFTNFKRLGINNTILKEVIPQVAGAIQKKYEYLVEAQLQAIQTLSLNISPINKCSFLNWHIQALQKLFMLETFGYTKTVLLAEGPFKNHHGLDQIHPNSITPNTLPNAVIYCTLSIANNIKRIQNRLALTGNISTIYNSLNKGQLEELVTYTHEIARVNVGSIKMLGIPIFEVDLTDHTPTPVLERIQQFITSNTNLKPSYQQLQYV